MSFILDALRKSENARQRQGGPGLSEVAVAAPKTKTSTWATAAVVLLLANLVAVGVLMLRRARAPDAVAPVSQAASAATPSNSAVAPPAAAAPQPTVAAPLLPATTPSSAVAAQQAPPASAAPPAPAPRDAAAGVPPMLQPADVDAPGPATRNPLEYEVSGGPPPVDPVLAERGASIPAGPPAVSEYPTSPGSVVYQQVPDGGATAGPASALPTIDEIGLQGGVPELHIDLHVYAESPQGRFVFINKRKYREGETLQEGPRVEEITRNGVVLNQHGRRFILPRQ
jgi:general secretion pathway protein B